MKKLLLFLFFLTLGLTSKAQWVNQPTGQAANSFILSISAVNEHIIWAVTSANEVLRTINGGTTWTVIPVAGITGYTMPNVNCITAIDASAAWITVVETAQLTTGVFRTTNGGITWTKQTSAYSPDSWGNMIHFFNVTDGVTFGDTNGGYFEIYTTSNGGLSWVRVPLANLPPPAGNNDVGTGGDLYAVYGDTIWISVLGMRVLKSGDKGLHWTVANTGLTPASSNNLPLGLAFKDSNNGLVLANSELRKTTDGGLTWSPVTYTGPVKRYLAYVPGTPNTYVSTGIGSSYTTDGGNTWISIENTITHGYPAFTGPAFGWSGGRNIINKYNGNVLKLKGQTEGANQFQIYPNPGGGIFNITHNLNASKSFTLEVYDVVGNKVKQQQGNILGKHALDLSSQKKGVYMLHILTDESRIIEKVVLQ